MRVRYLPLCVRYMSWLLMPPKVNILSINHAVIQCVGDEKILSNIILLFPALSVEK